MFAKTSVSVSGKKRHRKQAFPGFFAAHKKKDEAAKAVDRLFRRRYVASVYFASFNSSCCRRSITEFFVSHQSSCNLIGLDLCLSLPGVYVARLLNSRHYSSHIRGTLDIAVSQKSI